MTAKVDIFVAVLTTDEMLHMEISNLLCRMHQQNAKTETTKFTTGIFNGISGYANARNTVADYFLHKTDCDWLWFIDQDIAPPDNALDLITIQGADIIAPLMPTIKNVVKPAEGGKKRIMECHLPLCAARLGKLDNLDSMIYINIEAEKGIIEVDLVGMGCTLISRGVLEHPGMQLEGSYMRPDGVAKERDPDEPAAIFRYNTKPNGRLIMGEDYDLCWRARKLGFVVKLDLDVFCGHRKVVDIGKVFAMKEYIQFSINDNAGREAALEV